MLPFALCRTAFAQSTKIAVFALCAFALSTIAGEARAAPNGSCLACHNRITFEPQQFLDSVHGDLACADCHTEFEGDIHGLTEVAPPEEEWLVQVLALKARTEGYAWAACGTCHEEVVQGMEVSHHVDPMTDSEAADGPFCGDCHGLPHYMVNSPTDPADRLEFVNRTCVPCHADSELIESYDLNPNVVFTYQHSLHGRAALLGSENAPSCVDCPTAHAARGADDPESEVATDNRVEVCASCHDGASDNFALTFSHEPITRAGTPLEYWVSFFFVTLTLLVILALLLHIVLDMFSGLRESLGVPAHETEGESNA